MPDSSLYDEDVYAWSEQQAAVLRRLAARGELPNELDWINVAEEIEDVGSSQRHAVESYLESIFVHLLLIWGEPYAPPVDHWMDEILTWRSNTKRRATKTMMARIDLDAIWTDAVARGVLKSKRGEAVRARWPGPGSICPYGWDDLLAESFDPRIMAARLSA